MVTWAMTRFRAALDALRYDLLEEPDTVSLLDLGDRLTAFLIHERAEMLNLPEEDPPDSLAVILNAHVRTATARGADLGGACLFEMHARRLEPSTWLFHGLALEADVYSSIVYFEDQEVGISCLYYGDARSSYHFRTYLRAADPLTIN